MNVFTPAETAANYAAAGVLKTRQPFLKLLLLGIAAGALIGFPVCVTNMATYAITNASAVRIIAGVLFAFGLGIVVLTGAELFTGNTLLVISLLDRRVTWCAMLRNWGIVYLGNFLGALARVDVRVACAGMGGTIRVTVQLPANELPAGLAIGAQVVVAPRPIPALAV